MTDYTDYEGVLAAIKTGIDSARRIKEREVSCADENFTLVTDDFIAWCVLQELRRANWSIVRSGT